jgi:hypothetical protein
MRVACVLDSGFEDSEFKKPVDLDAFTRESVALLSRVPTSTH